MRLRSAGISRTIAQRALPLAVLGALALAAPAAADPLGVAGAADALPAQATEAVQTATGTVDAAASEATAPAARVAAPVAEHVASRARSATPVSAGSEPRDPVPAAVGDAARRAADTTQAATQVATAPARELTKRVPPPPPADAALRSLGEGLRSLGVESLAAPLAALLSGTGLADLAPVRLALGRLLPPDGLALGTPAMRPLPAAPILDGSQSASAQPPAAEAGGRPESASPRMVPALTTDGAATAPSAAAAPSTGAPAPGAHPPGGLAGAFGPAAAGATGLGFAPLLGLLVLVALAAPRLLRRLDPGTATLRPAPFVCALERPG